MAEFERIRPINLPQSQEVYDNDVFVIDSETGGVRKIPKDKVMTEIDDTLTETGQAADAKTVGDELNNINDTLDENIPLIQNPTKTVSGSVAHFTDGAEMPAQSVIVNIEPQQSGTGTPSPDNVRQISGWESVNLYKSGKNLSEINETEVTTSGKYILNDANLPNSDYVISFELVNTTYANGGAALLGLYDANDVNFAYPTPSQLKRVSDDVQMSSLSQPINGRFYYKISAHSLKRIGLQFRSDAWGEWTGTMKEIQLEVGTEVTDYSPTTKNTIPVNLGRTVYGGTLDVVSGVLTVTHVYQLFNGSEVWDKMNTSARQTWRSYLATGLDYVGGEMITNEIEVNRASEGSDPDKLTCRGTLYSSRSFYIFAPLSMFATVDDLKAWLAQNPLQVCYELATPQTYTLTPTEVSTLLGENNVWADAGAVEVTYRRDINLALSELEQAIISLGANV